MNLPPEKLGDLIESYHKEEIHLKEQITDLCYFMKGGIEWESAWNMSFEEREIAVGAETGKRALGQHVGVPTRNSSARRIPRPGREPIAS